VVVVVVVGAAVVVVVVLVVGAAVVVVVVVVGAGLKLSTARVHDSIIGSAPRSKVVRINLVCT
jgi:hypothetical protein